jgi:outer membrane cobalamin receptor
MRRLRTSRDRSDLAPVFAGAWLTLAALVVTGVLPAVAAAQQERAEHPSRTAVSCDVIDGEDVARARTVTSALRSHVTGLHLTSTSGQAGGGTQMNMRGITSMRRSPPMVFLDGLKIGDTFGEGPDIGMLDQLNPEDVLLIEVFRGPAATTLYGTDASGGVIRVYTKRGNVRAELLSDPRARCIP